MFPQMAEILPEVEGERFSLKKFNISKEDCKLMSLRDCCNRRGEYNGLQPGTYVKLIDKQVNEIVMSDTAMERRTNYAVLYRANGHVLIGGLGIGMILLALQAKPEVKQITVIEKYPQIIDMVAANLTLNNKVEIINADVFTWKPIQRYDTIYMDIWNTISGDYWPEHTKLCRKYSRYLNRDNSKYWYGSWRKEDFKKLAM